MRRNFNKIQPKQKQGTIEQWVLLIVLLLLLFWEKVQPVIKNVFCGCGIGEDLSEPTTEQPKNDINLPTSPDFEMNSQSVEISKEQYERENDQDVLNIDPSSLKSEYFPDRDILKMSTNYGFTS